MNLWTNTTKLTNREMYAVKSLLIASLISYTFNISNSRSFMLIFLYIISLGFHISAIFSLYKLKNFQICRILMIFPLAWLSAGLLSDYSIPGLQMLIPITIFDVLAVKTWKTHFGFLWLHIILINFFNRTMLQPQNWDNWILLVSYRGLACLVLVIISDLFIFATLEKHMKESWVLKTSFEKSFRTMLQIFESSPFEGILVDTYGNIMFSNHQFLKTSGNEQSSKMLHKIKDFVHKDDIEALEEAIKKTASSESIENLETNIHFNGDLNRIIR